MHSGQRILGLVTARGGSKTVPGKNIRPLGGLPLIAWTVRAALDSAFLDRLILSTDSAEIAAAAAEYGCEVPFMRPAELATDTATSAQVVRHALENLDEPFDLFVLLQPTSPLRTAADIDACIRVCQQQQAPSVVSINAVREHPSLMYSWKKDGRLVPFAERPSPRRQDWAPLHILNGAVYVCRTEHFLQTDSLMDEFTLGYEMPTDRSADIDTELDLAICQCIVQEKLNGQSTPGK